jgi:hypothetical protein
MEYYHGYRTVSNFFKKKLRRKYMIILGKTKNPLKTGVLLSPPRDASKQNLAKKVDASKLKT